MAKPQSLALLILPALLLSLLPPPCSAKNILYRDETLYAAYSLTQNNNRLTMQPDCNLVLSNDGHNVWSSNTSYVARACHARLESDGRLVIISENDQTLIWETKGGAVNRDYVLVVDDHDAVIYGPKMWETDDIAVPKPAYDTTPNNILGTDGVLHSETSLTYADYQLIMQNDCNLVLYDKGVPVWHTNTAGIFKGCHLKMQSDGDLVVYRSDGNNRLWSSKTAQAGKNRYTLVLQPNRNLVIYGPGIWGTDTQRKNTDIEMVTVV
ncbi:hypothetical protein QJS10_CPA03g01743 [Acorus calamus]|uniref:Bulb-type lectin domain-containing protein n=1 Tax=Acorus calamus TaxID=4465 RepID=A0AAV9F3B3_ACOCL|nr:hypothetical protein QJS10_CPA03g01743 [Acorus calamus]